MNQGAEFAVWLRDRFRGDGWLNFSNFSRSFLLLVIYETNFHHLPALQMLMCPFPFNPAGLLKVRQILKQR
jgi:hypothetical protein